MNCHPSRSHPIRFASLGVSEDLLFCGSTVAAAEHAETATAVAAQDGLRQNDFNRGAVSK